MARFGWLYAAVSVIPLCLSVAPVHAASTDWMGDKRGTFRLVTASDTTRGDTLQIGLEFRYAQGWHGYWREPGAAGIPATIDWSRSSNLAGEDTAWPAPKRLTIDGLDTAILDNAFVLPVTLNLRDPHKPTVLALTVSYAACAQICVFEHANVSLTLQPGAGAPSAEAAIVETARAALPQSPEAPGITIERQYIEPATDKTQRLVVELRSRRPLVKPDLFVEGTGAGLPPAPTVAYSNDRHDATLTTPIVFKKPQDAPLLLTFVDDGRSIEFSGPAPISAGVDRGLLSILAIALAGGLILNLMPCVLPILSIKLFGLARHAGETRRAIRQGAIATAAGIVVSFLVLATVLIVVKLSGAALGWGIQFQQPWFLAGMAVVTTLFAASFFEWLPIRLPGALSAVTTDGKHGPLAGAFFGGVFSTLLATPCSAPFVGTAVGFALTRTPQDILAVFFCLAIGMALPFIAVSVHPNLVSWLPRPGRWMVWLRRVLGCLLLGTALWLLTVLWSLAGLATAVTGGLALTIVLGLSALAAHWYPLERPAWPIVATAFLSVGTVLAAGFSPDTANGDTTVAMKWSAFDPTAIAGLVASGKIVFVDVTATWCLTCKVNELTSLDRPDVRKKLADPNVVYMRADWTHPNPVIADYLKRYGRVGIPFNAAYGPRQPTGITLSEILTPAAVLKALRDAGTPATGGS
jgi:suppressor for copper-sensitivity B